MALQGTLETFALSDVLRLLASTKKTGLLRLDGERGHGELVVIDGELAGGSSSGAPRAQRSSEVLFELLRYAEGSFVFDGDSDAGIDSTAPRESVEEALTEADAQLREWREIEAVVPSPTRRLMFIAARDATITFDPQQWAGIVAMADARTTDELAERLDLAELPATRLVRDLVELGAIEVGDEFETGPVSPPSVALASVAEPVVERAVAPEPPSDFADVAPEPRADFASAPSFIAEPPTELNGQHPTEAQKGEASAAPAGSGERSQGFAPVPPSTMVAPSASETSESESSWDDDPEEVSSFDDDDHSIGLFEGASSNAPAADDPFGPDPFQTRGFALSPREAREAEEAAEMSRQLANLSPRAQQAVAAAAAAGTDEERERAMARADSDSDEPLNRNLLLKYLSSVDE